LRNFLDSSIISFMRTDEIREKFLKFFEERGHRRLPSSSLVPIDDPTLLFTNAGMVQFKKVFLGEIDFPYKRVTTVQKCVRAGGKHNDFEKVGKTARHHTFFEMLGNFSFGDYFKQSAIEFAWELITREFGLSPNVLWVSVYKDDEEAFRIWRDVIGIKEERILKLGEEDNFWAMGETGPCGPCTEIIVDRGESAGCGRPTCGPTCDCDRYLEIWNLVFMEFNRTPSGTLEPLPKKCVDTGMGLERIASVLQGVSSNYEIDILREILKKVEEISGRKYGESEKIDTAMRVIVDHSRASAFLIADGILPSNEGRGYVLRKMLRRAVRYGRVLEIKEPFIWKVADEVIKVMKNVYPELLETKNVIKDSIRAEEERFRETLERGLKIFYHEMENLKGDEFPAEIAFNLYDTFGFPLEVTVELLEEHGKFLNLNRFNELLEKQRRAGKESWHEERTDFYLKLKEGGIKTRFTGYSSLKEEAVVLFISVEGIEREFLKEEEEGEIIINPSPFYGEAGGQVGDRGIIVWEGGEAEVVDAKKPVIDLIYLKVRVKKGILKKGEKVIALVDERRRKSTAIHHTLTHLLHAALRNILGKHVRQMGSLVSPERLRFDFSHPGPLSEEEIEKVENLVNTWVREGYQVDVEEKDYNEAVKEGAIALFEEKYGSRVRVIKINGISMELCGGTHLKNTAEAQFFKIISQSSVQAGVRRVEALGGEAALSYIQSTEKILKRLQRDLHCSLDEIPSKVDELLRTIKELEKENRSLRQKLLFGDEKRLLERKEVNGIQIVSGIIEGVSKEELGAIVDREKRNSKTVILVGTSSEGKGIIVCGISEDIKEKISAVEILREIGRRFGGGGGGRSDFAQGGIQKAEFLKDAISSLTDIIKKFWS
jgi:alanyl-tRNA synthetase